MGFKFKDSLDENDVSYLYPDKDADFLSKLIGPRDWVADAAALGCGVVDYERGIVFMCLWNLYRDQSVYYYLFSWKGRVLVFHKEGACKIKFDNFPLELMPDFGDIVSKVLAGFELGGRQLISDGSRNPDGRGEPGYPESGKEIEFFAPDGRKMA